MSDYDLNSPDILCSPTNFSDIYFGGARNLPLSSDIGGVVDPDCSDNSNEGSMQVMKTFKLFTKSINRINHNHISFILFFFPDFFIKDWQFNMSTSASSTSRLFISSKYAPLTNITPTQAYLQHNFIYRPSWESSNNLLKSGNKKSKYGSSLNSKSGVSFSKSKNKNKHRNLALPSSTAIKSDGGKLKRPATGFDYGIKKTADAKSSGQSSLKKYDNRNMHIKEEPISDTEVRNESESDSDSDTDKKKTGKLMGKKLHDKSGSKKSDKGQKFRKSNKGGPIEECSLYDNNGNSDENSNDSAHNFVSIKSEPYQKTTIKMETGGDVTLPDGDGNITTNPNLDKSSSSVEEFDNEKPTKVVKVNINLEYDSEIYNDDVNVRKFHKYQRNIEMASNLQMPSFESANESFAFECSAPPILESGQQMAYSSSDSDSDDSDANDLDDSDSSCDECAIGPCNTSILPPLASGSNASSPAMSMSSYYNKNGEPLLKCIDFATFS